ncbi:transposase [Streptomyces sp. NPDC051000]|uniref:transposase n=1 Tax=unclassified Streptomyces TaxID=2593676 RepID=UPI0033ECBF86
MGSADARASAPPAVPQGRHPHRGRHPGAHTVEELRGTTNHQVVTDADTRLVVVVGRPLPGNRNDCKTWQESGAKAAVGNTTTIADGGYPGTGLVMPHRRRKGEELPD